MPIIALINTWKWFGISFVILLAGLYSISPDMYEAASMDAVSYTHLDVYKRQIQYGALALLHREVGLMESTIILVCRSQLERTPITVGHF